MPPAQPLIPGLTRDPHPPLDGEGRSEAPGWGGAACSEPAAPPPPAPAARPPPSRGRWVAAASPCPHGLSACPLRMSPRSMVSRFRGNERGSWLTPCPPPAAHPGESRDPHPPLDGEGRSEAPGWGGAACSEPAAPPPPAPAARPPPSRGRWVAAASPCPHGLSACPLRMSPRSMVSRSRGNERRSWLTPCPPPAARPGESRDPGRHGRAPGEYTHRLLLAQNRAHGCGPATQGRTDMTSYRRRKNSDTWHRCKNCSSGADQRSDYEETTVSGRPSGGRKTRPGMPEARREAGNCTK